MKAAVYLSLDFVVQVLTGDVQIRVLSKQPMAGIIDLYEGRVQTRSGEV